MTLNTRFVDMSSVPVALSAGARHKFSFRGMSRSRLMCGEVRYGLACLGKIEDTSEAVRVTSQCRWGEAYAVGIRFHDEASDIFVDGRTYSQSHRKGETHLLYLSGVDHIEFNTPRHTLETILPVSFVREIADDLEVPPVTCLGRSQYEVFDDPVLRRLAVQIQPYFEAPETLDPLFADHYLWSLGIYVCARFDGLATRREVAGGLTTWQERLAKDIIETSLVGGIPLTDLAALCGLQTSRFAHAFKRSVGVAPYRWLMQRRVVRAQEMLRSGKQKVADVALACGFADQSHLVRTFLKSVGTTPGRWQRQFQ